MNKEVTARRMDQKVIIVTGANSGIGKATALLLGHHGARLGLLDVSAPTKVAVEITSAGGEATAVQCDVRARETVEETIRSIVEKYGPLNGENLIDSTQFYV